MADMTLQKPAAGQNITLTPQADDRVVFGFDISEAALSRENDTLVISFVDGTSISLEDFYEVFTAQNMPTLVVNDEEIDGESFFSALGEELMPAAGETATTALGSGLGVDTLAGTLLSGINRLDGLDQDYPDKQEQEEQVEVAADTENDERISHNESNFGSADSSTSPSGENNENSNGSENSPNTDGTDGTDSQPEDLPTPNPEPTPTPTPAPTPTPDEATPPPPTPPAPPVDLAPTAVEDAKNLQEGESVTGNILDNDSAGDADSGSGKELISVTPPEGWEPVTKELCEELGVDWDKLEDTFTFYDPSTNEVLIVQKDGDFTFESPSGSISQDKTLDFAYTIEDADGDTSESKLTINVTNVNDSPTLSFNGNDNASHTTHDDAFDSNAEDGSIKSVEGSFSTTTGDSENTITIGFGDASITLDSNSTSNEQGNFGSITTENGVFTVTDYDATTGEVTYSYEQSGAADHSQGAVQEDFSVTVSDGDGNSRDDATGTITINIEDDGVSAKDDSVSLKEEDITADTLVTGNLLDNDDVSADANSTVVEIQAPQGWTTPEGWSATGSEVAQFESEAGVITFNEDGSYTFNPNDDYSIATDQDFSFGYTVQDSDGSTSSAEFELTLEADHGVLDNNDMAIEVVTLNLAVIVDSSGSMNAAAMDAIEEALEALGQSLDSLNSSAVEINLCLIDYNKGAQVQLQVSSDDLTQDNAFESLLSGVEWSGGGKEGTNMDAAFEAATGWFNSLGQDAIDSSINKTIFMTDGKPTYALEDTVTYEVVTQGNDADSTPFQTVTFEGKTYTLESYEQSDYNNAGLAVDAVITYTAEDGSVITCIQDNGTSGKGDMWFEGEIVVDSSVKGSPVQGLIETVDSNTVIFQGESYELLEDYTHDYQNKQYANDGYTTYKNADGDIITCLHDNGSSGKGDVWYEGEVEIDFSTKGSPKVEEDAQPLQKAPAIEVEPGDTFTGVVNVQGQTLNSAADIADGAHGHTWTENGVEYRLVQSEAANGTAINAPTLQVNVAGTWVNAGTVGVIVDGSGDYASENEKTHTQDSADALNEAMGYDSDNGESGLFAVGFGSGADHDFLQSITIDGQVYNTDDLTESFKEIMDVVAREVDLQMQEAVVDVINEALGDVEGVDASISTSDIGDIIELAEEGQHELLDEISNSIENTAAEHIQDGVSVDINGDGNITDDEINVQVKFENQSTTGSDEDDLLVSFGGSDTINAGDGHDVVFGGGGDDALHGGAGDDYLHGGSGNDVIFGGEGNDIIDGGIGKDVLEGGAGDDLILADINDTVHGGSGNDTIDLRGLDGDSLDLSNLLIDGGSEEDGTPGMDVLLADKGTDVDAMIENGTLTNVEVIVQGAQDDNDATTKEALESIENGSFDGTGWNNTGSIQGANGTTFDKFESDDGLTILVQQTLLNTSSM